MSSRFSAYLTVFNDWDILLPALRSIAPFIDELVVVDGAYKWMIPYVQGIGADPTKSDLPVYEAIETAGIPFRVISNVWENEVEKRKVGYLSCSNRYIFRVDADEIAFLKPDQLESFLSEGGAVGEMEVPLYVSPGWIVSRKTDRYIERAGFLFDSKKITSSDHVTYLWLVDANRELPQISRGRLSVFPEPIAFNAHLSHWRTPRTGVNRAAFYILNHIKACGAPWFDDVANGPLPDLSRLFEHIPAKIFRETLKGSDIVAGYFPVPDLILKQSPLSASDEQTFSPLFENFLQSHARQNADLAAQGRHILGRTNIDLTSPEAVQALSGDSELIFSFSSDVTRSDASVRYILPYEPWEILQPIEVNVNANTVSIDPFQGAPPFRDALRRILTMEAWCADAHPVQRFICGRAAGRPPTTSIPALQRFTSPRFADFEGTDSACLHAAEAASASQDWIRAAELWDELRVKMPKNARCWLKSGEAYCQSGMLDDAECILDEAVTVFPDNVYILYWHTIVARRKSDSGEALIRAERLRNGFADFWPGWVESADALEAVGHRTEAEARRREAVERFPDEFWPNYAITRLTAASSHWPTAVRVWAELVMRFPSEPEAMTGLQHSVQAAEHAFAEAIDRSKRLESEVESFRSALRMALKIQSE